jgi:ubiquitin-conjugating enzyme E2 O
LCTDSKATVVWQDGTEEKDIPTTELYYSVSLDDHEFFPGEWVVPNANDNTDKYGVVQKVNFLERTAEVTLFLLLFF